MVARLGLIITSLLVGAAASLLAAQQLAPTPEIRIAGPNGESLTEAGMIDELSAMRNGPRQPVVIHMQSDPIRIDASSLRDVMGNGIRGQVDVQVKADPIDIPPLEGNVRVGIGLDGASAGGLLDALFGGAGVGADPPAPEVDVEAPSNQLEAPAWIDAFVDRRGWFGDRASRPRDGAAVKSGPIVEWLTRPAP